MSILGFLSQKNVVDGLESAVVVNTQDTYAYAYEIRLR